MLTWDPKDADEVLDYDINWSARLVSDTISTSSWAIVSAPDSSLHIDSQAHTTTTSTVWLSGGTLGQTYKLHNVVVTAGGRTMSQTAKLKIKEH